MFDGTNSPELFFHLAITLRAVRSAFVRSESAALRTLDSINEHRERTSPNASAEDTTPSSLSVSFHALTAKLNRYSFFVRMNDSKLSKLTSYRFMLSFSYSKCIVV